MRFKKRLNVEAGLRQIDIAPLIDCLFLLLIFFMLTSSFVVIPGINLKLPKASTAEAVDTRALNIAVSREDIIYVNDQPLTLSELEGVMKKGTIDCVFIKSDRDASLGVVVAIWDVCKKLGIERISIAATYE